MIEQHAGMPCRRVNCNAILIGPFRIQLNNDVMSLRALEAHFMYHFK